MKKINARSYDPFSPADASRPGRVALVARLAQPLGRCLLLGVLLLAWVSAGTTLHAADAPTQKLRIVVFGGHPDDPETGAGGLITTLSQAGHEVIVGYATSFRGDRQLGGEPEAVVRQREARAACKVMGAAPKFFPFAHEKLEAAPEALKAVAVWLDEIKPDIVVTHWPLDTHPNHQVASSLIWRSYRARGGWNLYFFEVMTDQQTLGFQPTLYLDIESVRAVKREACYCHASQGPAAFWSVHEAMHRRRGAECGVTHAEAYCLVEAKAGCPLLPVSFIGRKK